MKKIIKSLDDYFKATERGVHALPSAEALPGVVVMTAYVIILLVWG
jgi:hypothetical protein